LIAYWVTGSWNFAVRIVVAASQHIAKQCGGKYAEHNMSGLGRRLLAFRWGVDNYDYENLNS
jgi:hypothetical protein